MAKDTLAENGIPLNPAGINDNSPLNAQPEWYQTNGVNSLSEQCLQRCNGKALIQKFNSPILAIHGQLRERIFVETTTELLMFDTFVLEPTPAPTDDMDYILIRDEKPTGDDGGTPTADAFVDRDLNTIVTNENTHAALAGNVITLQPGTYYCRISCPAYKSFEHKAKLINISDSVDVLFGTNAFSERSDSGAETCSEIIGSFTIATVKDFKVQHLVRNSEASTGFGLDINFGGVPEIYTVVELWWKA